jgi:hypothetical protein
MGTGCGFTSTTSTPATAPPATPKAGRGVPWQSQLNVAKAAALQQALNLAASQALVIDQQFNGASDTTVSGNSLQSDSKNGLLDWFQFGGNTYLVEAVNSTTAAAAHAALGTNDIVVKITGIVDAKHIDFAHAWRTFRSSLVKSDRLAKGQRKSRTHMSHFF